MKQNSKVSAYVTAWCRMTKKAQPKESDINDAITERISYARKKFRATPKK